MTTLTLDQVSRWFGNVVAVNDVTMSIGPGVTGLLGPNGAGKSTLINMMAGFLPPSGGTVTLDGETVWGNREIYRRVGLVPEREAMYDAVSGASFVLANAKLHGLADPGAAAAAALETVQMSPFADRDISTYSKGMKQRIKVATALVHEPPVLLLDEPFNGMDPRQRMQLMDLLHTMGEQGRTILFSSHILEEVEQIAGDIQVVVAGRHAASGDFRHIRRLMTERPHQYWIRSDDNRALASAIIAEVSAAGVELVSATGGRAASGRTHQMTDSGDDATALHVQASDVARFVRALPQLAAAHSIRLYEVSPADEALESVFAYLVAR
ncbi:MAG: ABC transporter ATP-binding protein [Egibacteraceae bacterium]